MVENRVDLQLNEVWASGEAYEPYVGRWSRLVAQTFVKWLSVQSGGLWLDVGCGTGALTQTILQEAAPWSVRGVDNAEEYIAYVRNRTMDRRASFQVGDAQALPVEDETYDAVVSGFMLNFIPDPDRAVEEMVRACKPGGQVAAFVWDYAGRVQFMRHFWNAAAALDPDAAELDEGKRFPICNPDKLSVLFQNAGLQRVEVQPIDIWTVFKDFDDYWKPFLGGQGPAPGYAVSLDGERQTILREQLRSALPYALDGSIPMMARAWAVRGTR